MTKAESFAMQYGFYDKEKKHACCVGYNAGYKQAEKDVKDALLEWLKSELENGGPSTLVQHIINRINTL